MRDHYERKKVTNEKKRKKKKLLEMENKKGKKIERV